MFCPPTSVNYDTKIREVRGRWSFTGTPFVVLTLYHRIQSCWMKGIKRQKSSCRDIMIWYKNARNENIVLSQLRIHKSVL